METQQENNPILMKRRGRFFLIKNSHADNNFTNHGYFREERIQAERKLRQQLRGANMEREFVDTPASFGVSNAYNYLWNQSGIKGKLAKQKRNRVQTQHSRYHQSPQQATNQQSHQKQQQRRKFLPNVTRCRQNNTQTKTSQISLRTSTSNLQQVSYNLTFIYGHNLKSYQQLHNRHIEINLVPYLINTFLKCKINYKNLSSLDFSEITRIILIANQYTHKVDFNAKDVVNMSSIRNVFQYLGKFRERSNQWIGTIRYFFIPVQKVSNFQFQKLKDQLKITTTSKLSLEIYQQNIIINNLQSAAKIENLYDLLRGGKFIYDTDKDGYQRVMLVIKKNKEHKMFMDRIQRWKRAVPTGQAQSQQIHSNSNRPPTKTESKAFMTLSYQNYNKLYERYKRKHVKFIGNKYKIPNVSQKLSFIQKSKLIKRDEIFQ